jgi:hypothetical protein
MECIFSLKVCLSIAGEIHELQCFGLEVREFGIFYLGCEQEDKF